MSIHSYAICLCTGCGLRFPAAQGQITGARCPHCLGETSIQGIFDLRGDAPATTATTSRRTSGSTRAVLLDNIRSAWNVGSILRTADGFGFKHAFLCGITPTPDSDAVRKTALGAEADVPWSYHKNSVTLTAGLRNDGWTIWGLEETTGALPISRVKDRLDKASNEQSKLILVLGSEVTGIDPGLLTACEKVFMIPMSGMKRSFNVAVAFGVAAYVLSYKEIG